MSSCFMKVFCYIFLGLGAIYGENQLKGLGRNCELKVVDSILWKHFKRAA